jgi:hypothetical protein
MQEIPIEMDKEAKTMASTSRQEELLGVIRKSQEAMIAVIRNLAETVKTADLPKPPSVSMPFADKLPGPEDAVVRTYDFAEQLLASQRKFAENLLKAKPEGAVATTYDFAEQLLASQRKFAEELLRAKPEGAVASTYDFAEQLLASQRKFAEELLEAAAPPTHGHAEGALAEETYKPGQVVPRDGIVECARHHEIQDHVKAGTRFAPCSHHHEHSEGCTWQYV